MWGGYGAGLPVNSVSYFVDTLPLFHTPTPSEEAFLRGIRLPILRQHSLASTLQTHEGCFVRGEVSLSPSCSPSLPLLFFWLMWIFTHTHAHAHINSLKNTPTCMYHYHMGTAFGFIAEHMNLELFTSFVCLSVTGKVADESLGVGVGVRVFLLGVPHWFTHFSISVFVCWFLCGENHLLFWSSFSSPAQLIGVHMEASSSTSVSSPLLYISLLVISFLFHRALADASMGAHSCCQEETCQRRTHTHKLRMRM